MEHLFKCVHPLRWYFLRGSYHLSYSFDCNGTPAQKWVIARGRGHVQLAGTNFCLDAGSSPENSVGMKIWQCFDNLPAQDWFYTNDGRIALTDQGMIVHLFSPFTWNDVVFKVTVSISQTATLPTPMWYRLGNVPTMTSTRFGSPIDIFSGVIPIATNFVEEVYDQSNGQLYSKYPVLSICRTWIYIIMCSRFGNEGTYNRAKKWERYLTLDQNLCGTTLLPLGHGGAEDNDCILTGFIPALIMKYFYIFIIFKIFWSGVQSRWLSTAKHQGAKMAHEGKEVGEADRMICRTL